MQSTYRVRRATLNLIAAAFAIFAGLLVACNLQIWAATQSVMDEIQSVASQEPPEERPDHATAREPLASFVPYRDPESGVEWRTANIYRRLTFVWGQEGVLILHREGQRISPDGKVESWPDEGVLVRIRLIDGAWQPVGVKAPV